MEKTSNFEAAVLLLDRGHRALSETGLEIKIKGVLVEIGGDYSCC